jgi:XTP/dITP diphosphohydrolase
VEEEQQELQEAISLGNKTHIEEEFGDLMFSLINYARFLDVDPEGALEKTNKKFIYRFQWMEEQASLMGKKLQDMTLGEMDHLWNISKTNPPQS